MDRIGVILGGVRVTRYQEPKAAITIKKAITSAEFKRERLQHQRGENETVIRKDLPRQPERKREEEK